LVKNEKLMQYRTPVVVAALTIGMMVPARQDEDQPHTHVEDYVPINGVGRASVEYFSSGAMLAGTPSSSNTLRARSTFTIAGVEIDV